MVLDSVVSLYRGEDGPNFSLVIKDGKLNFVQKVYKWDEGRPSNPKKIFIEGGSIGIGKWSHIAVCQDYLSNTILYRHGSEDVIGRGGTPIPKGEHEYFFGKDDNNIFHGFIQDVKVWQGPIPLACLSSTVLPLTQEQIDSYAFFGLGAVWPFRDDSTADLVKNNNAVLNRATFEQNGPDVVNVNRNVYPQN